MRIKILFILITAINYQSYSQTDTVFIEFVGNHQKKVSSGKIINGRRIGKWETKFENKVLFECFYNSPDSSIIYRGFDNEGFLQEQSFKYFVNDSTLISNGYFETYSYNHTSKLLSCGYHKMGKLHNQYTSFFLDKNIIYLKCFFDNGIKVDSSFMYYENGQIEEVGFYKNWERIGLWKEYHENGKLRALGSYLGKHKKIFVNKIINPEILDFVNISEPLDYKKGAWNYYLPNGKLFKKEEYNENGKLVKCKEYK